MTAPVAFTMADFLMDAQSLGFGLLADLRARFPHAKRDEVYQAIAIAWTYQQSGWLETSMELEALRGAPLRGHEKAPRP